MTLEEQIKALLEASEKEAAEKGTEDADKESADTVAAEPAVKIDNPINPDVAPEQAAISPEQEIAAAEAESGEKEEDEEDIETEKNGEVKESVVTSMADLLAEDFDDTFKLKAQTIFEAAVKEQVTALEEELQTNYAKKVAALEEEFQDKLAQKTQSIEEELSEQIDGYLAHLAEAWKQDNIVALEAGIKSELTESFMGAIKQVFETHYFELPTEKADMLEKVMEEKTQAEDALQALALKAQELQEQVAQFQRAEIIEESVKGLTDLDAEKLKTLVEDFEFSDAATFEKKVSIVKHTFFENRSTKTQAKEQMVEDFTQAEPIVEVQEEFKEETEVDPQMQAYVKALTA